MRTIKAWAVVYEADLCFTNAPEIIGEGSVYQVYTNREDAEAFCRIPFADAEYHVAKCTITIHDFRGKGDH